MNNLNYEIKIIDDFLEKDDFTDLCNINIEKDIKEGFKVYHNEIDESGIRTSSIDKNLLTRIHKNCHQKAIEVLKELYPEKQKLYDYSDFTLIVTSKNSKFPIHDDTPNKILSGVIYLSPEKNSGTVFYNDKNGKENSNIEWRQNRAVFFSRKERETWHSYQGDGKSNRIALVYNLMTYKIKEVYEVEKKNYFFGLLRWKLNPYLFRFFKKYL
tara:strand:- start:4128 stop:4766 length:639 start_codon:yes stop_codon:yes gene_type:complete